MSSVLPSIFTRIDFWSMLLPGYVLIILGMVFFSPSFFSLEYNDIFAAVVFVVAGPAIGFTLSQAVILGSYLIFQAKYPKYELLREYSRLRMLCGVEAREELDIIDASVVFNSSTGVALAIIGSLLLVQPMLQGVYTQLKPLIESEDLLARVVIGLVILFTSFLLLLSSALEAFRVRNPLICKLIKEQQKWNAKLPSFCKNQCENPRHEEHMNLFLKKYPHASTDEGDVIRTVDPDYWYISKESKLNTIRCCVVCSTSEGIKRA